jgi:transketolase
MMENIKKLGSTRIAFVNALEEIMEKDPRVVMVSADSVAVFRAAELKERFPERVIEVGIAEQNAVAAAAGLASAGMIPFVCTYAGFSVMRACEQMRTYVGYPGLNVKFFGANGGMYSGEREGVTHQFFEDLGILRTVSGFRVIAPADAAQTSKGVWDAYNQDGPVYVRIGSGRDIEIYENDAPSTDKADILADYGTDALIVGCGGVLRSALEAAQSLKDKGINVAVVNSACVKPLDENGLLPLMQRSRATITIEDHNHIGGLGSALCELAAEKSPCKIIRMGLEDIYPESGHAEELMIKYGMAAADVERAVMRALEE